jgi:hypothetical protein
MTMPVKIDGLNCRKLEPMRLGKWNVGEDWA